jgi:hypothetical protein
MTIATRQIILRANAGYLLAASASAFVMDIAGIFFSRGPEAKLLALAPHTGIGFVEAHGLAFIIGVLLWRARPERVWHSTAGAVEFLLGTANLVFWDLFAAANFLWGGYLTTSLHWVFVLLQLAAAAGTQATASHPERAVVVEQTTR